MNDLESTPRREHVQPMAVPPTHDPRARQPPSVAVVIPCFRVARHVMEVIARIGPESDRIFVVDDACPEHTGDKVEAECRDARVTVLRHTENRGVGAAVITGYRAAITAGASVIVKVDGDGQMPPELIGLFVEPILAGRADYAKGNRFWDLRNIKRMPGIRIFGNATLSFLAKISTGYWDLFDPTNGYTAIHADVARRLPLEKVSERYFFESDLLFRLSTVRAVVVDIPMDSEYGDESSSMRIGRVTAEFAWKHARNATKRIFYNYFLRDFSVASLELVFGIVLVAFGAVFGGWHWWHSSGTGIPTPAGTVMLAGLPLLVGLQLLLAFVGYDVASVPRRPLHSALLDSARAE